MAKPTNIVWAGEDTGYPILKLRWKGRDLVFGNQKPQFVEQGLLMLPPEGVDLVPPRKYESETWGWFPGVLEGLTDDEDLMAVWKEFDQAANRPDYWNHVGPQGTPGTR